MGAIYLNNIKRGADLFDVTISVLDNDPYAYYFTPMEFGVFEFGNDNDVDTIYYPNNTSIKFTIQGCVVDYYPSGSGANDTNDYVYTYHKVLRALKYNKAYVTINKNSAYFFKGLLDSGALLSSFKEKSFTCNIVSSFVELKEKEATDNLLAGVDVNERMPVLEFILKIVQVVLPVTSITSISDLRFKSSLQQGYTLDDVAIYPRIYIGSTTQQENYWDILKEVCNSFGVLCLIHGNQVYLQSRWYHTAINVQSINKIDFEAGLDALGETKAIRGLRLWVRKTPGSKELRYWDEGIVITDPKDKTIILNADEVEEMTVSFTEGVPPNTQGTYQFDLWVQNPDLSWVTLSAYSTYLGTAAGFAAQLWKVVAQRVAALVTKSRVVYETTLRGTNWINLNFYNFETIAGYGFRPRKFIVDYTNYKTTIQFVEGGKDDSFTITAPSGVSQFTSLLKVTNLKMYDGNTAVAPINFSSPAKPLETGEGAYVENVTQVIEFDSLYNTKPPTIEDVEGNTLTVEDNAAYDDITGYIIYRFLSANDTLPLTLPQLTASNGEWQEYTTIPETKDRAYFRFEVTIPANRAAAFFIAAKAQSVNKLEVKNMES